MSTGFRKTSGGGRVQGRFASSGGPIGSSPFTQAQILHLMKAEFARARRYGFPVSCLLLQVDRMQSLVDIHGVELRDIVRRELARLVSEKTRDADHLGLISDDRYLLVLPHTDERAALAVGERVREGFAELELEAQGGTLALTLSIGVASCADKETLFFDTMLSQAEVALEWAIESGGNESKAFRKERFVEPEEGPGKQDE